NILSPHSWSLRRPARRFASMSVPASQSGGSILPKSTSDIVSFNPQGRSPVPRTFNHEADAGFWQENVGDTDSPISDRRRHAVEIQGNVARGLAVNFVKC